MAFTGSLRRAAVRRRIETRFSVYVLVREIFDTPVIGFRVCFDGCGVMS
jgi:hypothetical protein